MRMLKGTLLAVHRTVHPTRIGFWPKAAQFNIPPRREISELVASQARVGAEDTRPKARALAS